MVMYNTLAVSYVIFWNSVNIRDYSLKF